ncbi:Basic-leucine zipper (bZIP) transcription factor family protein [Abeliophyllum distichum]|uniref:Basic-leucine zipper (BZIP) transcription factor family protein n=1 Tax=Abeliophyllum distichum TaxID=126358 RepID=A0ABD1SHH3_9LAMI
MYPYSHLQILRDLMLHTLTPMSFHRKKTTPRTIEQVPGRNLVGLMGNREAVWKYRKKKNVHASYLEEDVKKLRFVNQQLVKKLQRLAILETEILRLRGLLLDLRRKVDNVSRQEMSLESLMWTVCIY